MELEKRLGLYQVFLRIYEHNRGLLDEILQLENSAPSSLGRAPAYVQGVVQGQQAYIVTNLLNGKTQRLFQPQKIWIIGRDRRIALPVRDGWMSRRHAAIQYIHNEGFYLVDLNSTNGSFVNGEPVIKRVLLQDGDRIRLGSLAITFFFGQTAQTVEPVPPEILAQINASTVRPPAPTDRQMLTTFADEDDYLSEKPDDTSLVLKAKLSSEDPTSPSSLPHLTASERSQILDRFLSSRHTTIEKN
ncbi:FHA domain-containing protein [Planktothrix sp. FACHB-1355]|uniref:FHA domain-containing protein n=1 Tax=Aerosakkonema funiforme FACHB-1375 TaxID=2949571 RepID=A0A926V9B0_9CYAN|nr:MULTISPECIES: FHA domain-containing protein [Oscillatoriales]MBD2179591.1 FHA domain-containing protein [Aerosakkonema funiforme FACHB-1375]MBD3560528.1 FHA domain-containing protein [Planktothrix sp. FACHB-1355]